MNLRVIVLVVPLIRYLFLYPNLIAYPKSIKIRGSLSIGFQCLWISLSQASLFNYHGNISSH